ncbi:hypothetical protein [Roseococcus sp. YIM B11640]|uniref:hypothetical protein n=1 Tax=Roseococcus sp. YIM B11640 TaxID=3133973 RepID=UPI003C7AD47A
MRRLIPLALLWTLPALPAAAQPTRYSVYCANEKIEVDSRTPQQMQDARGSPTCLLQSFDYLSDAQNFARRNFGGEGARCSCR